MDSDFFSLQIMFVVSVFSRYKIKELIDNAAVDISNKEHVENISYLKQYKKESYAEKEYALEKGICPRCNSKILNRGYHYRCSKCDFAFKI